MIYYKGVREEISNLEDFIYIGTNINKYGKRISYDFEKRFTSLENPNEFYDYLAGLRSSNPFGYEIEITSMDKRRSVFNLGIDIKKNVNIEFDYDIIYTKVKDINGYEYAKELKTGLIFPLYNSKNYMTHIYLTSYPTYERDKDDANNSIYSLYLCTKEINPTILKSGVVVYGDKIATQNDIEDYDVDLDDLTYDYKENVFNNLQLQKEVNLNQSEEMSIISHIVYYLSLIKNINEDDYKVLNEKYRFILDNYENKNNNITLNIDDLNRLKRSVEFIYLFNRNNKSGIYKKLKENINNSNDESSINEVDYLYELFLENKDYFTLKEQDELLKYFSIFYILFIKNTRVDFDSIINTYFSDLKFYILSLINSSNKNNISNPKDVYDLINNEEMYEEIKLLLGK